MAKTPELLAPCGSPDALDAALRGGADAVYLGGVMLNARMNARNFSNDALREAVRKCHDRGVKLYVTMNTQVYDREMNDALRYAGFLYEAGADALIVTDVGLISLLRACIPELELHASTQLSGHNAEAAKKLASMGLTRMVCARELSAQDLKLLCAQSPIEIEMFVHGALCVSHSGQCLLSSVIGGRSGNRGECAQPCRMKYGNTYPLSLKDSCLAAHISEILASGAASLKIEGRMKPPEYVYGVTAAYRRLLDERRAASPEEIAHMAALFSRGGFTDGYFTGAIDRDMLGVRSEEDKAASARTHTDFRPMPRHADPIATPERKASLPEKVESRCAPHRIEPFCSASFERADQIPDNARFDRVYLPLDVYLRAPLPGCDCGVTLPPVITDSELPEVERKLAQAYAKGARHALVGNIGHIEPARRQGFILHGDFRLNIYNLHAQRFWEEREGMADTILSPELTLPQIRDIGGEKAVVVYGYLPVMLLEKKVGTGCLKDRTGAQFRVLSCGKRDILLNSVPIYMADKQDLIEKAGGYRKHFLFTSETRRDAAAAVDAYARRLQPKCQTRRIK